MSDLLQELLVGIAKHDVEVLDAMHALEGSPIAEPEYLHIVSILWISHHSTVLTFSAPKLFSCLNVFST